MKTTLRTVIKAQFNNGLLDSGVKVLTTSHILNACLLMMGAGNMLIGFLQSIPSLSNVFGLLNAILVDKGLSARRLSIFTSLIARPFWFLSAGTILFAPEKWALVLFSIFFTMGWCIAGMTGGAFWPWIKSLIPKKIGPFFLASRMRGILVVRLLLSGVLGLIISYISKFIPLYTKYVYTSVFFIAGILGLLATRELVKIQEDFIPIKHGASLYKKIFLIVHSKDFFKMVSSMSLVSCLSAFFLPFSSVFLIKQCGFETGTILLWVAFTQVMDVLFCKILTYYYHGYTTVLRWFCSMLIATVFALWLVFLYHSIWLLILPGVLMGFCTSASNLALSDAIIFSVPKTMSSLYISIANFIRMLSATLGTFLAGFILSFVSWGVYFIIIILFSIFCSIWIYSVKSD